MQTCLSVFLCSPLPLSLPLSVPPFSLSLSGHPSSPFMGSGNIPVLSYGGNYGAFADSLMSGPINVMWALLLHHHDGTEASLWGLMILLGKQGTGRVHPGISKLEDGFHYFSFSRTKLANGKGKQRHHTYKSPSCFLLPQFLLPGADWIYPASLEQGMCPLSTSLSSLLLWHKISSFMLWEGTAIWNSILHFFSSLKILNFYKLGSGLPRPLFLSFKSAFSTEKFKNLILWSLHLALFRQPWVEAGRWLTTGWVTG